MANKSYIFILQDDEDGISVGRKQDVDNMIMRAEDNEDEIDFTTIGRIAEPLTMDFKPEQIEWYGDTEHEKPFIDKVVMHIINFIS